jgi:hypothetical protein
MEEAPENGKESPHSAHATGLIERESNRRERLLTSDRKGFKQELECVWGECR